MMVTNQLKKEDQARRKVMDHAEELEETVATMEKKAEEFWLVLKKAKEEAEATSKAKAEAIKHEDAFCSGLLGLVEKLQGKSSGCVYSTASSLLMFLWCLQLFALGRSRKAQRVRLRLAPHLFGSQAWSIRWRARWRWRTLCWGGYWDPCIQTSCVPVVSRVSLTSSLVK